MKKFLSLLLVAALALVAVVPAFAQDAEPVTIAETVVAAASAETPEFTTLLAAVQAADPAVLEALSNPEANLTVFAPTDAAFAALQAELGDEAFNAVLADPAALTSILLFHVLDGRFMAEDVGGLFTEGVSRVTVPTLNGQTAEITLSEAGDLFIDNAPIVVTDVEASNGVIHVIDAVMLPETRTIAEIVVEAASNEDAPQFTTLLAAVQAADPAILEALSANVPGEYITVFAPTDEAFAALGEDTIATVLADQALLSSILLYHVAPGNITSHDIVRALTTDWMAADAGEMPAWLAQVNSDEAGMAMELVINTLNGATATISFDEEGNGYINDAMIVTQDVEAANGVIHIIDAVILPPTE